MLQEPSYISPSADSASSDPLEDLVQYRNGQLIDEKVLHDLRGPMSTLLGNLQLIQATADSTLDAKSQRRINACLSDLQALMGMVSDLQCLVHLVRGDWGLTLRPVCVGDIVTRLEQTVEQRRRGSERPIEFQAGAPDKRIHADPRTLQRALQTLLTSAVRLSRSGAVAVAIETESSERVVFRFCYHGITISPDPADQPMAPDIHERQQLDFDRIDRARGLMFVRCVAACHHGELYYEALEDGGCFQFKLPTMD